MNEYDGLIFYSFVSLMEYVRSDRFTLESYKLVCRFVEESDIDLLFRFCILLTDCLVVIEEAEVFLDPRSTSESFRDLINRGRHWGISLLCVVRRVPEVTIAFRAQCTSIISFVQHEPIDLRHLYLLGFGPEEVSSLPEYSYAHVGEAVEAITFELPREHTHREETDSVLYDE